MLILQGTPSLLLGDETHTLKANTAVLVPVGVRHQLFNRSQDVARILFFVPTVGLQREVVKGI
jgi:mannose-6-phosphate isomerase-like protein (cupin superfamily)